MKKILYINPLGEEIIFISFTKNTDYSIFFEHTTEKILIPFLEFAENFPKILTEKFRNYAYEEIWTIAGPGPFTKMRIISLAINALKFSFPNIKIKSIHFFELFHNKKTIPLIEANNKEFLSTIDKDKEVFFQKNLLPIGNYEGYFSINSTNIDKEDNKCQSSTFIHFLDNTDEIMKIFSKKDSIDFIQPIYIKPPHITYAK